VEILRREKELVATVLRAAEVERKRIETLAEAERQRQVLQATGAAESARLQGQAQADVIRLQGIAEAEIISAKGNAEADAMQMKAAAFKEYNQAAIVDKVVAAMPEVIRAMSEPLTKVDRITVVSTGDGNGSGTGLNRVTQDMTAMIAQVPAVFESLTGLKVSDLMHQVPSSIQFVVDVQDAPPRKRRVDFLRRTRNGLLGSWFQNAGVVQGGEQWLRNHNVAESKAMPSVSASRRSASQVNGDFG
jgi:hypothetical protein